MILYWIFTFCIAYSLCQPQATVSCPGNCLCDASSNNVVCNKVTNTFLQSASQIPAATQSLHIMCPNNPDSSGRPVTSPDSVTYFTAKIFSNLLQLKTLSVVNCPIKSIQTGVFSGLEKLESLEFRNLLLESIAPKSFEGSRLLNSLWIIQSPEYMEQSPGALAGTNLRHLKLIDLKLSGDSFKNLVAAVSHSLKVVEWKANKRPVLLPTDTFKNFQLEEISFQNNQIPDFDFLNFTLVDTAILSSNPISSGFLNFRKFSRNSKLKYLDFGRCNLHAFPEGLDRFPSLEDLYLGANKISVLESDRLVGLFNLTRLDLSSNNLQSFSQTLEPLFLTIIGRHHSAASIYLGDNPLHCNCEVRWMLENNLLSASLPKDLICRSGQFVNNYLSVIKPSQLICTKPEPPYVQTAVYDATNSSLILHRTGYEDGSLAVYLLSNTLVHLTCSSKSDPAPTLMWIDSSVRFPLLKSSPSGEKTQLSSQLAITIRQSTMTADRVTLICAASNWNYPNQVNTTVVVVNTAVTPTSPEPPVIFTRSPKPQIKPELGSKRGALVKVTLFLLIPCVLVVLAT